ncbi:hypothetical protein GpartN1_g510.t1 [Galdieria partita]|uniref:Thioredoxin-like fold domain-containing protein n=1 Tax=Galdieria partita TaxID=83374 RepID=A0A9C7PR68_9RHOD|nr:hypothetical protein GpartN1_g510.t1 [Galdieria partita]
MMSFNADRSSEPTSQGIRKTLLEWSRYYLGYPRPPSRVIEFRGRKHLIELLKQGKPVLVALSVEGFSRCEYFRKMFEQASFEFDQVQFVWVNCGQAIEFCRSRQPPTMPWMELFQLDFDSEAKVGMRESDSTFKVEVKPFIGYHPSVYGIKVFLRKHGILPPAGFQLESKSYS